MSEKPTRHEIAAMPFPASVTAMRKHYVKDWAIPTPEGVDGKRKFAVKFQYSISNTETETVEVEAWTEEEAEELGVEKVCGKAEDDCPANAYADVECTEVKLLETAQ